MKIIFFNQFHLTYSNLSPLSINKDLKMGKLWNQILRTLSWINLECSGLKDRCDGKKLTYHRLDLTLYFWVMGLTELKFGLTSWKYCASKLTIAGQNYLPNMLFSTEYKSK